MMRAAWSEYLTPEASTDRGWLKARCGAPSDYTYCSYPGNDRYPVWDEDITPAGWREQSTLGNYLDYGPVRPGATGPQVHCICYASGAHVYVSTVSQARVWIEGEARRVRPELFGRLSNEQVLGLIEDKRRTLFDLEGN